MSLLAILSVLVAVTPIVVTVVRTALHRWVPIGDNGLLLLRTRDVGTANTPLLGTWTSASLSAGIDFNNPGPLLFDLLAVPVKAFGAGVGMPVGLGIVNGASVVGAAWIARRQAGSGGVVAMMVAAGGLVWSMGSELLVDPWQPHAMMLPFLFLLAALWGIVCGDLVVVVWFAAAASLLVQTHVSYSFLVLFCTVGALAAIVFHARRDAAARARLAHLALLSAVVVVVLWAQPLVEQVSGRGRGNLSRLLSSSSGGQTPLGQSRIDQSRIGWRLGVRLIADVIVLPPWFSRASFVDAIPATPYSGSGATRRLVVVGPPSLAVAFVALAGLMALTALLLRRALRIRLGAIAAALGLVEGLIVCAVVAMILMPAGVLGLSPHQMRWLWPLSAMILTTILASAVALIRSSGRPAGASTVRRAASARRAATVVGVTVTIAFAASATPTYIQAAGPTADHDARSTIVALTARMTVLRGSGPLIFDDAGLRFAEPYSGPVMARLGELGVDFEVERPGLQRQVGDERRISGTAVGRLFLREGQEAVDVPPGVDRVAFVPGLDAAGVAERDRLVERWTTLLADGAITLTAAGQSAFAAGRVAVTAAQIDGIDDPRAVIDGGLLADPAARGWIAAEGAPVDELVRLGRLQARWRFRTVALFLAPVGT